MIDLACLIEDDPIHVFLTEKFLGASGKVKELIRYANGEEAYFALREKFEKKSRYPVRSSNFVWGRTPSTNCQKAIFLIE